MPINNELAELFKKQSKLQKELSQVDSDIHHLCKALNDETIEETKSSVTPDDTEWGRWLTSRRQRIYNLKNKEQMKKTKSLQPGYTAVYALYDGDDIVYIGITKDFEKRMWAHQRSDKVFDRYEMLQAYTDRFYAIRQEHQLIEEHNPKYNKSKYI